MYEKYTAKLARRLDELIERSADNEIRHFIAHRKTGVRSKHSTKKINKKGLSYHKENHFLTYWLRINQ
mgnify:FL=1